MAVAIVTKYLGPTDHRGSRIVASVPARIADRIEPDPEHPNPMDRPGYWRLTVPYGYEGSPESEHHRAAVALCERLGWPTTLIGGATDTGYVFVFDPNPNAR